METINLTSEDVQFIDKTAKYIHSIIMNSVNICGSWGYSSAKAIIYKKMAALQFSVNGFIHQGIVIVAYNEGADAFELFLINEEGKEKTHIIDVYFDELVPVLDREIETQNELSDDYRKRCEDWINKNL